MTTATAATGSFETDTPTVRETLPLSLARRGEPAPARRLPWRHVLSAALAVSLCAAVGVAAWRLGAGRARKEDPVQAVAGVTMHAKPGDEVRAGQPLLTLHTATPERFTRAREALAGGIVISEAGSPEAADAVARRQRGVILERIG